MLCSEVHLSEKEREGKRNAVVLEREGRTTTTLFTLSAETQNKGKGREWGRMMRRRMEGGTTRQDNNAYWNR